jgi:Na+-driven multidrug efflux pump
MKKSKFIKSSIILLIGGIATKILGMLAKIILTREIGTTGMGLYSLLLPTFLLLLSLSGMGLSTALNVLISTNKYNNKNLIITSLFFSLLMDTILFIILFLFSKFIAVSLLHDTRLYYPLLCIGFILPFITISNIFRSYFFSKERMIPHVISNIIEDLLKVLIIYFGLTYFTDNLESAISFVVLSNIICELASIIIFLFCFPNFTIKKDDFKLKKNNIKAIFKIALPTTFSRLVGSFTYFLEPIILTFLLLKIGYTNEFVIDEYGIINGYVLPIIMLPSFFTNAISQALMPIISKNYANKKYKYVKNKIIQAIIISLIIGISFSIVCLFWGDKLLLFLYNTTEGLNYLKFLVPIFLFYYLEGPILSSLQAMNKANINLRISIINFFIRTVFLAILTSLSIGMYGLLISLALNILFTVIYAIYYINKLLKNVNS